MRELTVEYETRYRTMRVSPHSPPSACPRTPLVLSIKGLPDSSVLNAIVMGVREMMEGGRAFSRIEVDTLRAKEIVQLLGVDTRFSLPVIVRERPALAV